MLKLTLIKKGLILVSVPLLFQLAFVGLVVVTERANGEASSWSVHTKEVIGQAGTVLQKLVNAETGIRGFILTGDPSFAEPYYATSRGLPAALEQLQALVSDNPTQHARARLIASNAADIMEWYARNHQLVQNGARDQAVSPAKMLQAKNQMDDLRRDIDIFVDEEERLETQRDEALAISRQHLHWTLRVGTIVTVISTVLLAFVFSRGISDRLTTLLVNTERLKKGNELIPPLAGSDEITRIDHAFHDLAAELARSARALREQTALLQAVLDNMGDGLIVADLSGKFLIFNPAAERIVGVGALDTPPERWTEAYGVYLPDQITPYPADKLPLTLAMQGISVDGVELFVRRAKLPEGAWLSITGRPLLDAHGVRRGGIIVLRDINALKRREQEIRENAELVRDTLERFRLLTESAVGYALIFLDLRGNVESWNAGAERLKGYRADEIIGRHFSCFHPPETMARDDLGLRLKVAAAGERVEDEGWRVRKDGSRFWANVVITALRDQEGRLRGFAKLTRDLTERKRSEDDIRKLNEDLDQRIVQRTADLAEANRELAQKNQENEMFVYSASHDLRSPLVNLEGFSKELGTVSQEIRGILVSHDLPPVARDRGLALLDGDMAESIRYIQAAVLRLSKIIDALLRLSRAGKVEYLCQAVEVQPIVARIVDALSGTIAERHAVVTVGDLPSVVGDPAATEMIFANLIANALNYLDARRPGGIVVASNGQEKSGSGRHVLYVKDNGLGIAEAYKAKVFKAFQRMHPDAAKGEGVGLSVVQRIVERLGGTIWFDSVEGQGTTFFVALPSVQENTCSPPARSDNAPVLLLTGDKGHGH